MLKISFLSIILFACYFNCSAQKDKEVDYEFPSFMKPEIKEFYMKEFEKGKILYNLNCATCHNFKVKKKVYVPDFSINELTSYEIRMKNAEHETNMSEVRVTTEELGYIITYLTYKKKSGYLLNKQQ